MQFKPIPISLLLLAFAMPAIANSRIVSFHELEISQSQISIAVPPGDGLILDFSEIGQTVRGAAFGDPSQVVISGLDGDLCSAKAQCKSTGASVLLLRRVQGVSLPGQTRSGDGGTTLTLITDGKMGRKVLHLRIVSSLRGTYTALVISPNITPLRDSGVLAFNSIPLALTTPRPLPPPLHQATLVPKPQLSQQVTSLSSASPVPQPRTQKLKSSDLDLDLFIDLFSVSDEVAKAPSDNSEIPSPPASSTTEVAATLPAPTLSTTSNPNPSLQSTSTPPKRIGTFRGFSSQRLALIADAHALNKGINLAISNKQLTYGTSRYYKAQTAIGLLKNGHSRSQAAYQSGLSLDLINKWIALGQSEQSTISQF